MRKVFLYLLFFNVLFVQTLNAQSKSYKTKFFQNDFEKNKLYNETYHLYKHKNSRYTSEIDSILPFLFVDDRNYKGVLNYGVQFKSKDFRAFHYIEGRHMYFLKIFFERTKFYPKDSIIEIEGYVSGGWGDFADKKLKEKGLENRIDVVLGEKTDTIYNYNFGKVVNKELIDVKLNGIEVTENTVLDTFPAFYLKNNVQYQTPLPKGNRNFKIKGKVTNNTLLVFGGLYCYSEIFDISAMVYNPKKNKSKKNKQNGKTPFITLIQNNQLISKNGIVKSKEINYYTYTDEAENCIFKRQFAKAKEQYNLLDEKYNTIFASDIHNAIRCAILSRDYKSAFYFGKKLARKGVNKKYFNSKKLNVLRKNSEWNQFITTYDSIYSDNENKKNIYLKEELERLTSEDQADYGLENRKDPKVLFETTERVTSKLIDLLQKEGYPSEEKIGVCTKNDTILISFPDFNVLIRHAYQQNPKNLVVLNEIIEKSYNVLEYDKKRSGNHRGFSYSCFHIYKGNLYSNKSCGVFGINDIMVRKIKFRFNNPNNFLVEQGDYIIWEYDEEHAIEKDKFYEEHFNFIMKLTDDWDIYEK